MPPLQEAKSQVIRLVLHVGIINKNLCGDKNGYFLTLLSVTIFLLVVEEVAIWAGHMVHLRVLRYTGVDFTETMK